MFEQISCPKCEVIRDAELVHRDEMVTIKGREVVFKARISRCTTCGEEFETPDQLDSNLIDAREAYARLFEAPTAEALVSLRSRYGASQKAFGLILGFGELTMNSYERGTVPDSTNRLLLKLAENPTIFMAMYAVNSARIGALQRKRIEASPAFRSAESWKGLEALFHQLSPLQREKIEKCAQSYHQSVVQQILSYVSVASFQDYSKILLEATWSEGEIKAVSSSYDIPRLDEPQAAS